MVNTDGFIDPYRSYIEVEVQISDAEIGPVGVN
jgi:hypothetical protein